MVRFRHMLGGLGLLLLVAAPALAQSPVQRSALHDFSVVTVADGLINPWSMAWLPNGDMLITERPGRLRVVRDGHLLSEPVLGVPAVLARGQGGLFDVLPHPDFENNQILYISFAKPIGDGSEATTAVVRGTFENDRFTVIDEIFESESRGNGHYGARMAWHPDGTLYITVGDRQAPPSGDLENHPAQDLSNHHGVTIRLNEDGSVPDDNPFLGQPGVLPEIWSYGHRNAQGLAINDETGDVWLNEHGPQGGDELNLVTPGLNYGWPVVGYGVNYRTGLAIHEGTLRDGMQHPVHFWVPSIATSGLMIYTGDRFPGWRGSLFVGGMGGERVSRLAMNGQEVVMEETLVSRIGRVRDVRQGPDGFIYLAIEARQGAPTPVVRLEPAGAR